ncbi:acyltransferase [Halovenus salina]|uniref:acyltransferase n=1 Tax=Halovenus salina TaxID=1510225 RepID=UPI002260ECD5|nr:acyltransferase [Halovenus salina]
MNDNVVTSPDCSIDEGATVGYEHDSDAAPTEIGANGTVRAGTILYCDVTIGADFATGHNVLIREETMIGDDVLVGTNSVIDGYSDIGSHVSIQTGVYVPSHTTIEENVFLGPCCVLTNDPYPVRQEVDLEGPTIERGASIGANATVLPGVTVGENAFVAAGAVVIDDVPPNTLAAGVPAERHSLPKELQGENTLV